MPKLLSHKTFRSFLNMTDFLLNLVCSLIFFKCVLGNIIDTSIPIVIHDNGEQLQTSSSQNAGETGGNDLKHNYFGYSLAFLKGYQRDTNTRQRDNRSTIFIGVPKETQYSLNSGVVWRCEFNGNENPPVTCSIMKQISNQRNPTGYTCSDSKNNYLETQTQQWIGASLNVRPNSREILACAPRWNDYAGCADEKMPGACYLASEGNTILLNPLNRKPALEAVRVNNQRLTFHLYRFAEFGFSSYFTDSGQLIAGAPATRRWKGAMIVVNNLKERSESLTIYNNFDDIGVASLNGYAVTSGRSGSREQYFASGAPRARRLYGAVTISYSRRSGVQVIFQGEQFGSYFGYALATLDLDNDGYDELLVGAPFYTPEVKSGQKVGIRSYNTGCVLIFNLAQLQDNTEPIMARLCMDSQQVQSGSRFGSAVAKIGDINFDSYEDFAICAPYDDNGQGTIFIYHGGSSLSNQPAQVIRGKSLNIANLRGFGTYLIGGRQVDIDGNATPDLVVGAFQSRHVVILRTRPVARVSMKISFYAGNNSNVRLMRFLPTQQDFIMRTCVSFDFKISPPSEQILDTWMSFELGPKTKQVKFLDSAHEKIQKLSSSKSTCVNKTLVVVDMKETNSSSSNDTNENIQVRARLKYNYTDTSNLQSRHASVVISPSSPNQQNWNHYSEAYTSFNAYLPVPIPIMNSEWGRLSIAPDNCNSDEKPECNPELEFQLNLLYETNATTQHRTEWKMGNQLVIGQYESLVIQVVLENKNGSETAYNPVVRITIGVSQNFNMNPNLLMFVWELSGNPGRCRNLDPTSDDKIEGVTTITLGQRCIQVIQPGKSIKYQVKIGNWGHLRVSNSSSRDQGHLKLQVEAFPEQIPRESVKHEINVPLQTEVNINVKSNVPSNQVEIDPVLARSGVVDIGQYFIITNNGSSGTTMEAVRAEILIPTHAYLEGANLTEVIGVADPSSLNIRCTSDVKFFELPSSRRMEMEGQQNFSFPVENNDTANSGIRSKRSTKPTDVSPEKVSVKKSNDKFITLSGCEGDTQKSSCQKIVCKMDLLPRETAPREIKLQIYILENALGELVTLETKGIRVTSVISVYYQGAKVIQQTGVTQRNFSTIEGISALALLGAGAGGFLLLILTVFVLFKFGFFRRKTKEDLKQLKRQTMLMDQNAFRQTQEGLQALMESEMHEEIAL